MLAQIIRRYYEKGTLIGDRIERKKDNLPKLKPKPLRENERRKHNSQSEK
jgi:hypothetical protein